MHIFTLVAPTLAGITLVLGDCSKDEDCVTYSKRLSSLPLYHAQEKKAGYACIASKCTYVVSAGNVCRTSSDCSEYAFLRNALSQNRTDLFPQGVTRDNIEPFLATICSPDACSIASSCEVVSTAFYPDGFPSQEKCCRGIQQGQPCLPAGVFVETCKDTSSCIPDSTVFESNRNVCSVPNKQSTQWIGIVLTLIGAAITNMGLNLQKFALRKRHEKVVRKKEQERLGLFYRLTSLKISLSNFYKNMSSASLTGKRDESLGERSEHTANPTVSDRTKQLKVNESGATTPTKNSESHVSTMKSYTAPDADKQEFQKSIGFGGLFKNQRWLLGLLVFVLGNLCNFAAFNFAAQSLLAPLGSFSLVVNVIVAPLLNSEVWTWKDIVGVLLIIAGSTIVVIFAGFPPKDYNLCVLLKLFRQPATVAFLVVTCSLIGMIFFTILFVEKNLDLKEASAVVIEQTLQEGKLVDVQTNPHAGAPANDITVTEEKTDKGFKRIVTIPSKPKLRKKNDDSDNSDDEIQVEQPHHPIVDIDGVPVEEFLKAKTTTGSVHSLALTFELENSEVDADKTSVDGAASMEEAKEKVVVLPRKTAESKPNRFVEFTKRWVFFQKLYSIQWVPRLKEPIPLDSFIVRYILPIAYASIGGLMGTMTVLFAKATIHLIEPTLFQNNNQFTSIEAYMFTVITLFTAVSQIYWINNGLARYDALIQIPVFYVSWTLFDVVGGGIYYEEFRGFSVHQFILFCLGIVVIFCGVFVLAGRLKSISDSEKKES